jgi:ABC-2 type transport system ATP-binding protein
MTARETPPIASARGLMKAFGDVRAVDGIDFDIPAGSVVGVIGANGAGKTTTLRMLATLEVPDAGTVSVGGADCLNQPREARARIGWMPDHTGVQPNTLVTDYLDFFARAHGLQGEARRARLVEVMQFTDLVRLQARPMKGLSKGELQRLSLARTLLHDPDLLILDEPAAGLDPKARIEFRNLVHLLRDQGKTLIISSHILSELGEMCDRLIFIDQGRIVFDGKASELGRTQRIESVDTDAPPALPGEPVVQAAPRLHAVAVDIRVASGRETLAAEIASRPGWRVVTTLPDGVRAEHESDDPAALARELAALVAAGIPVCTFAPRETRLEDAFVQVLKRQEGTK